MKLYVKLLLAFLQKFRLIIILSVFLGLVIFLSVVYIFPKINIYKTKTVGYVGRYTVDTLPFEISSMISSGLVKVNDNADIEPMISDSWQVDEDGKKWTFHINENIIWQNHKKFVASDVNYNFSDVEITKNEDSVTFTLNEPYIPFIVLLEKPIFKKGLMGVGEWRVDKLSIKGEYIQKLILKNSGEKQIIKFYPTEEQAKLAFKLGEIDILKNVASQEPFSSWQNATIKQNINLNQIVTLFINTDDPVLSDKNIRQALNYAIDKSSYISRAYSPINPDSFYFNPQVKSYDHDLERAKTLIEDSNAKIPDDYSIRLIASPNLLNIADEISNNWNELGIKSNVMVSSNIPDDYQVFITIFDTPKDPDRYSLWHSTQVSTNITRYKNLRIDKLLEDGRVEQNKEERKKIYLDFQRYLVEDSPAIFLYHPIWYDIIRK